MARVAGNRTAIDLMRRAVRAAQTWVAWRRVLLRDPCSYCWGQATTIDHIHPLFFGGENGWRNKAPACQCCNLMKADGSLIWMLWRLNEQRLGRYRTRVIGYRLTRAGRVPIRSLKEYQGLLRKPQQLVSR